jgi:hypothetical protein
MVPCTPSCYCMLLMQPTKIKSKPPKFMFVMFDMYVKLPPDASPIAVNKFYFLLFYFTFTFICDTLKCIWSFYIQIWVFRCDILLKCSFWLFYTNNINQNIYLAGIWLAREYSEGEDVRMI